MQRSKIIEADQSSPYYSPAAAAVMKRTVQERHALAAKARTARKGGSSSRLIENAALSASVPDLGYSSWKSNKPAGNSRRAQAERRRQASTCPPRNIRWDGKDALAQSIQASKSRQRAAQATERRHQSRGARRTASAQPLHGSSGGLPVLASLRGSAASQPMLSSTVPLGRQEVQQLGAGGSTVYVPATFDPRAPTVQYNIPAASAVGAVEVLLHAHKQLAFQSWWKRQGDVDLADGGHSQLEVQSMNSSCYSEGTGDNAWDWWPDEAGLPEHRDRGDAGLGSTTVGPDRPMHLQQLADGGSVMTFSDMSARSKRTGPEPSIDEIVARVLDNLVSQAAVNAWATSGSMQPSGAAPVPPAICAAEHATYMQAEIGDAVPREGVDSQPSFDSLVFGESSAASVCSSIAELLAARVDSLEVTSLYAESVDMQPESGRDREAGQPARELCLHETSLASITPRPGAAKPSVRTTHESNQATAAVLHSPPSLAEVRQNASALQQRQHTAYRRSTNTSQQADDVWDVIGFGVECEPEAKPGPSAAFQAEAATAEPTEPTPAQLASQEVGAPAEPAQEAKDEVLQLQPFAAEAAEDDSHNQAALGHSTQPAAAESNPQGSDTEPAPDSGQSEDAAQPAQSEPQQPTDAAASTATAVETGLAEPAEEVPAQPEAVEASQEQAEASAAASAGPAPEQLASQQATDSKHDETVAHESKDDAAVEAPTQPEVTEPASAQASQQPEQSQSQQATSKVSDSEQPDAPSGRSRFPSAHAELLIPHVQDEDTVNVAILQEYCAKYDQKRVHTISKHWYAHRQRLWRALEKKYPGTTEPYIKQVQARLAQL